MMATEDSMLTLQSVENWTKGPGTSGSPAKSLKVEGMYKELLAKGRADAANGDLTESLATYKKAYEMKPTEKIKRRIKSIEDVLREVAEEAEEEFMELDNGLVIFKQLVERLYPHQIEGVKWIYDLRKKKKNGGILADDMGLGKTIQVIAALSAMYDMELIRNVLLVLPLSLIPNWQKEFEKWAPGIKIKSFYGSVQDRTRALEYSQRRPSVCITTYGLVQTQWEQLGQNKMRQRFTWDYVILDEGHKIKNPSKTTKRVHTIPARNRLILTGTPVQNNLRELWALLDWVTQGTLLGTQKTFKTEYETPITRARQRGASSAEIRLGNYMSESLRKIVGPYILRRTKGSVTAPKQDGSKVEESLKNVAKVSFPKLKKKNDFVIWTYLSAVQETIYRDFLAQDSIKELLASKRSPLVYLNVLKKICDHPRLLARRACQQLGLEANDSLNEEDFHTEKGKECAANRIDNISDATLIEESGKLQFLLGLLKRLKQEGHRTLIFSLSRKVLNIIHRILINEGFKVMRLDGTITKLSERDLRVKKFQQDSSYEVFLLTTQVGGVGLTLTAADRVVIFDPSWNPATDLQAVDRIYRIGQDKNVVVYRLITCGTVEEKIYRRQIFKDSIIKQSTGDNKDPYRYFTNHELKELFQIENTRESMTQRQLQDLHSGQRCLSSELDDHLAYIHSLPMFGVSDHDLMFSQDPDDVDADGVEEDSIRNKVAEAQNRIQTEAKGFSGTEVAEQRWGENNFDWKKNTSDPKVKEDEPVYEIDGLYDKLDLLTVDDDAAESAFNQSQISMKSEHTAGDEVEDIADSNEAEPISVKSEHTTSDEVEEIAESSKAKSQTLLSRSLLDARNDVVMVEDSPVKNGWISDVDMDIQEIDESSCSDVDLSDDENRDTPKDENLLSADISCIPIPSKSPTDARRSHEKDAGSKNFSNYDDHNEGIKNTFDSQLITSEEDGNLDHPHENPILGDDEAAADEHIAVDTHEESKNSLGESFANDDNGSESPVKILEDRGVTDDDKDETFLLDDENGDAPKDENLLSADISCIPIPSKSPTDARRLHEKDARSRNFFNNDESDVCNEKTNNTFDNQLIMSDEEDGNLDHPLENSILDDDEDVHDSFEGLAPINDEAATDEHIAVDTHEESKYSLAESFANDGNGSESAVKIREDRGATDDDKDPNFLPDEAVTDKHFAVDKHEESKPGESFMNEGTGNESAVKILENRRVDDDGLRSVQNFEVSLVSNCTNGEGSLGANMSGMKNLLQLEELDNDESFRDLAIEDIDDFYPVGTIGENNNRTHTPTNQERPRLLSNSDASTHVGSEEEKSEGEDVVLDDGDGELAGTSEKGFSSFRSEGADCNDTDDVVLDDGDDQGFAGMIEKGDSSFRSAATHLNDTIDVLFDDDDYNDEFAGANEGGDCLFRSAATHLDDTNNSAISEGVVAKRRRRSTANIRRLLSSSDESEEDVNSSQYRVDAAALSSEEDTKWSALELSVESEDDYEY